MTGLIRWFLDEVYPRSLTNLLSDYARQRKEQGGERDPALTRLAEKIRWRIRWRFGIRRPGFAYDPLVSCAIEGLAEFLPLLIEAGVEFDEPVTEGMTPLQLACEAGQLETARILLQSGAQVTRAEGGSPPALYLAAGRGHRELVETLLAHGAGNDPEQVGLALGAAVERNQTEVVRVFRDRQAPAPPFRLTTALATAVARGWRETAELLLAMGARPDHREGSPVAGMSASVWRYHLDGIRFLARHGADPNAADHQGVTPLMLAATLGSRRMVELLLELGANPVRRDARGRTALMLACARRHGPVVELLSRYRETLPMTDAADRDVFSYAEHGFDLFDPMFATPGWGEIRPPDGEPANAPGAGQATDGSMDENPTLAGTILDHLEQKKAGHQIAQILEAAGAVRRST